MNICLILSGSIAAYKACELASRLVKAGHQVQTMATEGALHFVGVASLEGLTDRKVYTDLWAPRETMSHINLRKWSDLFIFYPATANRINQLAAGLAQDLLGATFLANNFEKPFWIAPAMNTGMYRHPATQRSLDQLATWGCTIIEGEAGRLACGDVGEGRLAEPGAVFAMVEDLAASLAFTGPKTAAPQISANTPSSAGSTAGIGQVLPSRSSGQVPRPRALVTGGAMSEAIDGVRFMINRSSGRTASTMVSSFLAAGWDVDYLHHRSADLLDLRSPRTTVAVNSDLRLLPYRSFQDFEHELQTCLEEGEYQCIVHAAAVSDYRIGSVSSTGGPHADSTPPAKLESGEPVHLELLPTPKLLPRIRRQAHGNPLIVAFKLTVDAGPDEGKTRAQAFLDKDYADLVVWNDTVALDGQSGHWSGDSITAPSHHPFTIFHRPTATAVQDSPHTPAPEILGSGTTNAGLAALILAQASSHASVATTTNATTRPSTAANPLPPRTPA